MPRRPAADDKDIYKWFVHLSCETQYIKEMIQATQTMQLSIIDPSNNILRFISNIIGVNDILKHVPGVTKEEGTLTAKIGDITINFNLEEVILWVTKNGRQILSTRVCRIQYFTKEATEIDYVALLEQATGRKF
jgi:hypothetical protein